MLSKARQQNYLFLEIRILKFITDSQKLITGSQNVEKGVAEVSPRSSGGFCSHEIYSLI